MKRKGGKVKKMAEKINFHKYKYTFMLYLVRYTTKYDEVRYIFATQNAIKMPIKQVFDENGCETVEESDILVVNSDSGTKTYRLLGVIQRDTREEVVELLERYGNERRLSVIYEREDGLYLIQTLNNAKTSLINDLVRHPSDVPVVKPAPLRNVKIKDKKDLTPEDDWFIEREDTPECKAMTTKEITDIINTDLFLETFAAALRKTEYKTCGGSFRAFYSTLCKLVISTERYFNRIQYVLDNSGTEFSVQGYAYLTYEDPSFIMKLYQYAKTLLELKGLENSI